MDQYYWRLVGRCLQSRKRKLRKHMYTIFESKMSFQGSFHDNCKMQCHPVQFARMIEHGADIQFQLINI